MSQQIDLREVEKRSFASRFQDGILDMWLGIVLVGTGLAEPLSEGWPMEWGWLIVYGVVCAVGAVLTWTLRKVFAAPRSGMVRFGPAGKRRQVRATLVMVASLVFSVLLVALTFLGPSITGGTGIFASSAQVGALVAAWMLAVFSIASYVLGFGRGYVIGALYALGLGFGEALLNPWLIVAAALLVVLMGLIVFVRFVRETPLPPQEAGRAAV
jgi:hypothetical protein